MAMADCFGENPWLSSECYGSAILLTQANPTRRLPMRWGIGNCPGSSAMRLISLHFKQCSGQLLR